MGLREQLSHQGAEAAAKEKEITERFGKEFKEKVEGLFEGSELEFGTNLGELIDYMLSCQKLVLLENEKSERKVENAIFTGLIGGSVLRLLDAELDRLEKSVPYRRQDEKEKRIELIRARRDIATGVVMTIEK